MNFIPLNNEDATNPPKSPTTPPPNAISVVFLSMPCSKISSINFEYVFRDFEFSPPSIICNLGLIPLSSRLFFTIGKCISSTFLSVIIIA